MGTGMTFGLTAPDLRAIASSAATNDLLRILAPAKSYLVKTTIRQLIAIPDYVQSLSGYLRAN